MQEETKQILEIITDIQDQMSGLMTKADGTALEARLIDRIDEVEKRIMAEIRDIRTELAYLKERVDGMTGYAKEIDELYARVGVVEKKLGVTT